MNMNLFNILNVLIILIEQYQSLIFKQRNHQDNQISKKLYGQYSNLYPPGDSFPSIAAQPEYQHDQSIFYPEHHQDQSEIYPEMWQGHPRPEFEPQSEGWYPYPEGPAYRPKTTTTTTTTTTPTTPPPTTAPPTTPPPTTLAQTTIPPTSLLPTTPAQTTLGPTTNAPTTPVPTTPAQITTPLACPTSDGCINATLDSICPGFFPCDFSEVFTSSGPCFDRCRLTGDLAQICAIFSSFNCDAGVLSGVNFMGVSICEAFGNILGLGGVPTERVHIRGVLQC